MHKALKCLFFLPSLPPFSVSLCVSLLVSLLLSVDKNDQLTIYNMDRKRLLFEQTEDYNPEDSLLDCSEKLLQEVWFSICQRRNIKQVGDTFLQGLKH